MILWYFSPLIFRNVLKRLFQECLESLCPSYMSLHTHPSCGERKRFLENCLIIWTVGKSPTQASMISSCQVMGESPYAPYSVPLPTASSQHTLQSNKDIIIHGQIPDNYSLIYMVNLSTIREKKKIFLLHQNADIALLSVSFMESQHAVRVTAMWEDWDFVHMKEQLVWVFSW